MNPNGHHWIRDKKRKRIYERDGYRCVWCGGKLTFRAEQRGDSPTLDHVLPRALGGGNGADNLVTSCRHCNGKRKHMTAVEWCGTFPAPGRVFARMLDALMSDLPSSPTTQTGENTHVRSRKRRPTRIVVLAARYHDVP